MSELSIGLGAPARAVPRAAGVRKKLLMMGLSLIWCWTPALAHATDGGDLWARYYSVLDGAYSDAASAGGWPVTGDFERLIQLLEKSAPEEIAVIATANEDTLLSHAERPEIQTLVVRLLQLDAYRLAERIRNAADEIGDRYARSKLNFEFARYHLGRNEWEKCQQQLDRGVFNNALSPTEKDYASVMRGILSQRGSEHRAAIPHYTEIPNTSPHFSTAQLNLATVYIRQDWWTDAHHSIKNALERTDDKTLRDRLYTTLGFSQLQKEFYRDARTSFRRVRTASPYSVRALFGLGMAALHQGDYPGALNAFRLLKQKDSYDKSVVEAYLMLPITLEKLGQVGAASASFNEAIAYYGNYGLQLEQALLELKAAPSEQALETAKRLSFAELTPPTVRTAMARISEAQALTTGSPTRHTLRNLLSDFESLRISLALQKVEKNYDTVQHYLNQARFGLARLHDAKNREES